MVVAAIPTAISRIQPDGTAFGQASDASSGPLAGLVALLALITVAAGFAAIVSLMLRYRKSQTDEREQLKWFLFAGALLAVAFSLVAFGGGGSSSLPDTLIPAFFVLSLLGIPIATGVAILRYRLYDIDVVISRTLVYGSLAVFISAVCVGIAVGIGAQVAGASPTWVFRSSQPRSWQSVSSRFASACRGWPTDWYTASAPLHTRFCLSSPNASPSRTRRTT